MQESWCKKKNSCKFKSGLLGFTGGMRSTECRSSCCMRWTALAGGCFLGHWEGRETGKDNDFTLVITPTLLKQ